MWRTAQLLGLLVCLAPDLCHRRDECIQCLAAFALGRLDQQTLRDQQWKVGRGRVKAEIQQPLRYVHCLNIELLRLSAQRQDELVTRTPLRIGGIETDLLQSREQIVGIQGRELANAAHALAAEQSHVYVRTQQYASIAAKA